MSEVIVDVAVSGCSVSFLWCLPLQQFYQVSNVPTESKKAAITKKKNPVPSSYGGTHSGTYSTLISIGWLAEMTVSRDKIRNVT